MARRGEARRGDRWQGKAKVKRGVVSEGKAR